MSVIAGVNVALTHTEARFPLGIIVDDPVDIKQRYRYVRADDAVTVGDAVALDFSAAGSGVAANVPHLVTPAAAVATPVVGVAHVAIAAGSFGFITIEGVVEANVATSVAQGNALASSATAGELREQPSTVTNPSQADFDALVAATQGVEITALAAAATNKADVYLS